MAHLTTLIADSGGWGQRIMVGWALLLILAVAWVFSLQVCSGAMTDRTGAKKRVSRSMAAKPGGEIDRDGASATEGGP